LVQQLSVEEGLVFDNRLGVEDHQVLEALGHGVTSFPSERIAGIRARQLSPLNPKKTAAELGA
jgi:hypothetical protein